MNKLNYALLGVIATLVSGTTAIAGPSYPQVAHPPGYQIYRSTSLGCSIQKWRLGGLWSLDVTNTSPASLPQGTIVHWSTGAHDKGQTVLNKDVKPNATTRLLLKTQIASDHCGAFIAHDTPWTVNATTRK